MLRPSVILPVFVALAAVGLCAPALAQDDPQDWSSQAARGAFDLCRSDAPDAAKVAQHGEVWGWPTFVPYLEHPVGFKRDAGGESRRSMTQGDKTYSVEVTVQSGQVTSAAPSAVRYFRCNIVADQPVNASLESYFTSEFGAPAIKAGDTAVWLMGAPASTDTAASDDAALKPVIAGAVGMKVTRIELTRERGIDRAKLSIFEKTGG